MLDLVNYFIHILLILQWIDYTGWCSGITTRYHFDVYDDINAYGRWFWAGDGLADSLRMIDDLEETTFRRSGYTTTAATSAILICVQLFKNLDFHPQFGLISRTLGHALMELF